MPYFLVLCAKRNLHLLSQTWIAVLKSGRSPGLGMQLMFNKFTFKFGLTFQSLLIFMTESLIRKRSTVVYVTILKKDVLLYKNFVLGLLQLFPGVRYCHRWYCSFAIEKMKEWKRERVCVCVCGWVWVCVWVRVATTGGKGNAKRTIVRVNTWMCGKVGSNIAYPLHYIRSLSLSLSFFLFFPLFVVCAKQLITKRICSRQMAENYLSKRGKEAGAG